MSWEIFLIAAVPAAFVVLIGFYTKSKFKLILAALLAGALGVVTGHPMYMAIDIVAVAIGFWFGWRATNLEKEPEKEPKGPGIYQTTMNIMGASLKGLNVVLDELDEGVKTLEKSANEMLENQKKSSQEKIERMKEQYKKSG